MMGEISGYQVCSELRKDALTKHIPIILLTTRLDKNDRILGFSKGADAYILKPFSKAELLTRCIYLIENRKSFITQEKTTTLTSLMTSWRNEDDTIFIKKAISAVLENIEKEFYTSAFLARTLDISESGLYKKLKAITGKSTAIFIRSIRLEKAKEILQEMNII